MKCLPLLIPFLFILSFDTNSHGGRTNASGCHTNSKTGDYHCHGSKPKVSNRINYCHIYNNERRCGYAKSSCQTLARKLGGSCELE